MKLWLLSLCILRGAALYAGGSSSADYQVPANSIDAAGRHATSVSYSSDGVLGGIGGMATGSAPVETVKSGYVGQLYEVTGLQVTASPATVNEGAARQLSGAQLLDDLTTLAVPPSSIAWSVLSGPLTGISSQGLVTAGVVYQNTAASVQCGYLGKIGELGLTVLDTVSDNYGSYAGDGVGDGWQVQYFGFGNPNAGPLLDLDYDGLPNLLEYALNLNPGQGSALPVLTIKNGDVLEFFYSRSKDAVTSGRLFQVEWSDSLGAATWGSIGVMEQILSEDGTVQHLKATVPIGGAARRFLRLRVQ